jgi:cytosine/adenosine deaminase-related metal-dependent hydrolase
MTHGDLCCACGWTHGVSRRGLLCTGIAAAATVPALVANTAANAQTQPSAAPAPGRPILIKNGCVLSLDPAVGDFERADVLVSGNKIAAVGPNLAAPDAEVIDASRAIVLPGFIDTHRHMWEGILRNIIPDSSLGDYFKIVQRQLGPHYRPEDVYAANLVSALGAIEVGITTILDWSHIQNSPEHTDAAIKALTDSGIRAVFAYGNPANGLADFRDDPRQKYPEDIRRLRKQYFSSDDQLLTLALASLSNPPDRVADAWAVARDVGAPITIHVGVGNALTGLVQKLGEKGVLKADTTYIHCCTLTDTEFKMIADSGGTFSIAGYVEMIMGHGTPPIQKVLDLGLRPSLSIDVETTVPGDLFTQMRTILALQHNNVWMRSLAGEKNLPKMLTARDVIEFATIEGARANHLDRKVGTLTPGKEADLILLRTDRFSVTPMNSATGAIVTSMNAANVDTVLIAGKVMKRNGQMVGVDYDKVAKLVDASRDYTMSNAKYERARL